MDSCGGWSASGRHGNVSMRALWLQHHTSRNFKSGNVTFLYKKLSYRRGTARRAMLVNLCYVSRANVSKSHIRVIQGHWQWCRSIGYIWFSPSIATMSLSCTVSEISSLISQNWRESRDSEHIPFGSNISCMHHTPLCQLLHEIWSAYLHQLQRYDWGQIKNGSHDSNHAHLRGGLSP